MSHISVSYAIAFALKSGIAWYETSDDQQHRPHERLMTLAFTAAGGKFVCVTVDGQTLREEILREWDAWQRDVVRLSWGAH